MGFFLSSMFKFDDHCGFISHYKRDVIFCRQDIPVSENTDHYMFQNLEPNQNYSVSVTMRNGVGEGPPAIIYISTMPEPTGTKPFANKLINPLKLQIYKKRKRDINETFNNR